MRPSFLYRLFLLFLPAALLVVVSAWMVYRAEVEHARRYLAHAGEMAVHVGQGAAERALDQVGRDVRYLAQSQALKLAVEGGERQAIETLAADWVNFSRAKQVYDKISWLDQSGMEQLRVNFNPNSPIVVPAYALQNKSARYFFTEAIKLRKDEIYLSPFDLNVEDDQIETPHKPTIRIGTPLVDSSGKQRGILLINYLGKDLLDLLRASHDSPLWLLNPQGYWLLGPKPEDEWGFMFRQQERSMAHRYPAVWQRIVSEEAGAFSNADGHWTFRTVRPLHLAQNDNRSGAATTDTSFWKLVHLLPQTEYAAQVREIALRFSLVTTLALLVLLTGAWQIAATRREEQNTLGEVSKARLDLEQRLADMSRRVQIAEEKRTEVETHVRMLTEECHAISKATSDGFWLTDNKGTIIDVNPAYCEMMDYQRDEVIGHPISVFEVHENPQQVAIHIQRIRRMGRDRFTACHRTRNGTLVDLDVSVVYIPTLDQFAAFLRPAPAEDTR
jgi:PAS domain S-box-containing protein